MFFRKKRGNINSKSRTKDALIYYHGGADGLSIGEIIIPRNDNPKWHGISVECQGIPAVELGDRGDTVSITTDIEIAKGYAGEYMAPSGARVPGRVYEVRPLCASEPDPDWNGSFPTIARCARGAEIVAVLDQIPVQNNPSVLVKALADHYTYTATGAPVYDSQGYVIFTPELEQLGRTRASLRALGKWPRKDRFIY